MQYEKIDLGSYNLHIITTNKFKSTTVSINFREKLDKKDITIRKFLFQMLCTNTYKYNTSRLFEIKLEDLYSLGLSHSSIKFGNIINSYIDIKFLNNKYSDNNLLRDSLDFLFEILFNPNVKNNEFDSKTFEMIKNKLEVILKSEKENVQKYTLNRALELMDNNDPISYNLWGYKEDLDKINTKNLYDYYIKLLKTNIVDIFVVGDVDKEEVIKIFKEKFKINTIKRNTTEPFITYKSSNKTKVCNEIMNLKQSKLAIICKLLNLNLYERRYVLPLYSLILGGGSISRLFTNVREKNSLCYSISSFNNTPNSIMMIYSGIDNKNYEKALKLIKKEIKLKNISDTELINAKKEMITSIETLLDSVSGIINYYFGMEVFKADDIDTKIINFNKVTINDLEILSKKIKIAMIYLLKGENDEEE